MDDIPMRCAQPLSASGWLGDAGENAVEEIVHFLGDSDDSLGGLFGLDAYSEAAKFFALDVGHAAGRGEARLVRFE
jgi:hypothetical protein